MPSVAGPDTSQLRCSACGRYFDTETELLQHETECRLAKSSTAEESREVEIEDRQTHLTNDVQSNENRFQHGTVEAGTEQAEGYRQSGPGLNPDDVAARAYRCWHERGCPHGSPEVDWRKAEEELLAEAPKSQAATA